jgi:tetratricopeptide (TPR) repeat protein
MTRKHLEAWAEFDPKNAQVQVMLAKALFNTVGDEKGLALSALKEAQKIQQGLLASKEIEASAVNTELETPLVIIAMYQSQKVEPGKDAAETKANKEKNKKKTIELYEQARKEYDGKARPLLAFAGWYLDIGEIEKAKALLSEGLKAEANTTDKTISRQKLVLQGLQARYQKDYAGAEKQFNSLYTTSPDDFFAANQLALSLAEQTDPDKLRKAVAIAEVNAKANEQNGEARATLGWCYFKSKRYDDAEKLLESAIGNGQVMPDTAYYLAQLYHFKGKKDDAYRILKKAIASEGVFVNREDALAFMKTVEKDASKEVKEEVAKEEAKSKEGSKEAPKDSPKDGPKDSPKDTPTPKLKDTPPKP